MRLLLIAAFLAACVSSAAKAETVTAYFMGYDINVFPLEMEIGGQMSFKDAGFNCRMSMKVVTAEMRCNDPQNPLITGLIYRCDKSGVVEIVWDDDPIVKQNIDEVLNDLGIHCSEKPVAPAAPVAGSFPSGVFLLS